MQKRVSEAENEISRIEAEIKALEDVMASGQFSPELYENHSSLNKQLENAMSEWELASMDLDAMNG